MRWALAFAPQTWGSTLPPNIIAMGTIVCPADAGVYPGARTQSPRRWSLPRRRGGLPQTALIHKSGGGFAPQTRGSPMAGPRAASTAEVCPADAGVYPRLPRTSLPALRLPRTRLPALRLPRTGGGLPFMYHLGKMEEKFAPHRRGSTLRMEWPFTCSVVCPAQAGVYLKMARP